MNKLTRFIYFSGFTALLALLSIVDASKHKYFTLDLGFPYTILSTAGLVLIWVLASVISRLFAVHQLSLATLGKALAAWIVSGITVSLIDHYLLVTLLSNSAGKPVYSFSGTLLTVGTGFLLIIAWHFFFQLTLRILTLDPASKMRKTFSLSLYVILGMICVAASGNIAISVSGRDKIFDISLVPAQRTAIVFGAGIYRSNDPSSVLSERINTVALLYASSKVEMILLSGDGSGDHNEVNVMYKAAIQAGIPASALMTDNGGISTITTCDRAHTVFGIDQAILVTQDFHLSRAIFLCEHSGIQTSGITAAHGKSFLIDEIRWRIREFFAGSAAWLEIILK